MSYRSNILHIQQLMQYFLLSFRVIKAIEYMLEKDISDNRAIGDNGANVLVKGVDRPLKLLTHCNTGSLATAG